MKTEKDFETLHKLAVQTARNIHLRSDAEHGRSIDKYGNIIKTVGDDSGVYIEVNQDVRITVHNHPNEYKISEPFSDEDIYRFLTKKHLVEILVCGYGYYYYLRRGNYNGLSIDVRNDVKKLFRETQNRVLKEYTKNIENAVKSYKRGLKEINTLFESEYHKELQKYLNGKGLSYGKVKL